MKRILLPILIFLSLFSVSCGFQSNDASELIVLPEYGESENRILAALYAAESPDASFAFARRGKYQNSVNYFDLDSDGTDEVIVIYRSVESHPTSGDTSNILIFRQDGTELIPMFDIFGDGNSIDKMTFTDFNSDGIFDIVVGYAAAYDTSRLLYIYELDYVNKRAVTALTRRYSDFVEVDIDSDGNTEIVSAYFNDIDRVAYSNMFRYDKSNLGVREDANGSAPLCYSSDVFMMLPFTADDGSNAVIVTARYGSMLTSNQIIVWDPEKKGLKNLSYIDNPPVVSGTYGSQSDTEHIDKDYCSLGNYVCCDIDGDGKPEIPLCRFFDEDTAAESLTSWQEALLYLYTWYTFDGSGLSPQFSSYINENQGYIFCVGNEDAFEKIKAYINYKDDLYFYYVPDEDATFPILGIDKRTFLFSVLMTQTEPKTDETHILLYRSAARSVSYVLEINPNVPEKLMPDIEILKESFIPAVPSTASAG